MAKKPIKADSETLVAGVAAKAAAEGETARQGSTLYVTTQKLPELSVSLGDVTIRGRRNPKSGLIFVEVPDPLVERFERHTLYQFGHLVKATDDIVEADKGESNGGAE
jgi:hypothetical protein